MQRFCANTGFRQSRYKRERFLTKTPILTKAQIEGISADEIYLRSLSPEEQQAIRDFWVACLFSQGASHFKKYYPSVFQKWFIETYLQFFSLWFVGAIPTYKVRYPLSIPVSIYADKSGHKKYSNLQNRWGAVMNEPGLSNLPVRREKQANEIVSLIEGEFNAREIVTDARSAYNDLQEEGSAKERLSASLKLLKILQDGKRGPGSININNHGGVLSFTNLNGDTLIQRSVDPDLIRPESVDVEEGLIED